MSRLPLALEVTPEYPIAFIEGPNMSSWACPVCSEQIQIKELDFKDPFSCKRCGTGLEVSRSYSVITFLVAVGLSATLVWAIGLRDSAFLYGAAIVFVPIYWLTIALIMVLVPPSVHLSGPPKVAPRSGSTLDH